MVNLINFKLKVILWVNHTQLAPYTTKLEGLAEQKPYTRCKNRYKILDRGLGLVNLHRYIKLPQKITVVSSISQDNRKCTNM